MRLSFCMTCMNRLYQLKETLTKNLNDNRHDSHEIEFILVDFNSTDGLSEYIVENFESDIKSGF